MVRDIRATTATLQKQPSCRPMATDSLGRYSSLEGKFQSDDATLTAPDCWPRGFVRIRLDSIQVDQDTRIVAFICPG